MNEKHLKVFNDAMRLIYETYVGEDATVRDFFNNNFHFCIHYAQTHGVGEPQEAAEIFKSYIEWMSEITGQKAEGFAKEILDKAENYMKKVEGKKSTL